MTPLEIAELHAQLAHTLKLVFEGFVAAGFLTFIWLVAPSIRGRR